MKVQSLQKRNTQSAAISCSNITKNETLLYEAPSHYFDFNLQFITALHELE